VQAEAKRQIELLEGQQRLLEAQASAALGQLGGQAPNRTEGRSRAFSGPEGSAAALSPVLPAVNEKPDRILDRLERLEGDWTCWRENLQPNCLRSPSETSDLSVVFMICSRRKPRLPETSVLVTTPIGLFLTSGEVQARFRRNSSDSFGRGGGRTYGFVLHENLQHVSSYLRASIYDLSDCRSGNYVSPGYYCYLITSQVEAWLARLLL
jgi:hypothetical protein